MKKQYDSAIIPIYSSTRKESLRDNIIKNATQIYFQAICIIYYTIELFKIVSNDNIYTFKSKQVYVVIANQIRIDAQKSKIKI